MWKNMLMLLKIMLSLKSNHMCKGYFLSPTMLIEGTSTKLVERFSGTRPVLLISGHGIKCVFQQEEGSSRSRHTPSGSTFCIYVSDSRIGRKTPPHGLHLEPSLLLSINKDFKSGAVLPGTESNDSPTNLSDLSTSPLTKNTL